MVNLRAYLKSRKYRLFLQTQPDSALNTAGFCVKVPWNPACVCEISAIFFVFSYALVIAW